ncbi:MAG TPA: AraC family transcriptional regulator [Chitinophagaceae bacterium]|jgi:AraC-like DNA-binding protein|nr:AraC family transcriptional regulator [Chitinophagaceae bacterium]
MKPQLLKVTKGPGHSFSIRRDRVPHMNNRWHYHKEVELIHFAKGGGMQFIGDSIRRFHEGDVALVGPDLPHYWRFDQPVSEDADIRVVHFTTDFWGEAFLQLPECTAVKHLLEVSRRGLQIKEGSRQRTAALMEAMLEADGLHRILLLLDALSGIAASREWEPLSAPGFTPTVPQPDQDRISAIYDFALKHFNRKIHLEEIATVANISPHSFCRYFKARTRKTFSQFLMEVRIGHACKLLIENKRSIKQICSDSGFNNFTSFYKFFKQMTGKSPVQYQKEHQVV